jgi:hypothetical protein
MKKFSDKKDRLERFVRDNREEFDDLHPSVGLWGKIADQLPEVDPMETEDSRKRVSGHQKLYFDWRMAAAVVVMLGVSYLVYLNREYGLTRDPKVVMMAPGHAREVNQYALAIDQKRNELISLTSKDPELYREFATDLQRLEKSYQNLRSELPQAPDKQALMGAMVQNLQWQVELLNQQLSILQRIKSAEQSDEKPVSI